MRTHALVVLVMFCSLCPSSAAETPLLGEWYPTKTDNGLGGTMHFKTNGVLIMTFGAAIHGKYQLETNGETKMVVISGLDGDEKSTKMDFTITNDTLRLGERKGRRQKLTRMPGTGGEGLIGQWTGKHYTDGIQIMDFTTNLGFFLSVPFQTVTGSYTFNKTSLSTRYQGKRSSSKWAVQDDMLTLTSSESSEEKEETTFKRKASPPVAAGSVTASPPAVDLAALEKVASDSAEEAKIEALIKHLGALKDASFVRNDEAHEPKAAADMMRRKWEAQEDEMTAAEFIEKVMTASSSGAKKPYLIRYKDGKETPCADFLKAELKKLDENARKTQKL